VPLTTDTRLVFTSPRDGVSTTLPVTVSWTMRDPGATAYYVVFVDATPMAPGKTVRAIAGAKALCKDLPLSAPCPDELFLHRNGVYVTTQSAVTIPAVNPIVGDFTDDQLHEATVVPMDAQGRRLGESSWSVQFRLPARKAS